MLRLSHIILWRSGALAALLVGLVGIAVPVLPTVPFLIVAAWAGGKGWPTLEQRLLTHDKYGPHIRRWRERRAIPRRPKIAASLMMLASAIALQFASVPLWLRIGAPGAMLIVAIWLWRRPEE
ncbi:MAG: DUF454 domain-containing protein [Xanthomonadaceae bacterium]|nr:DUF454 domain-containing protein [Xanthomonadaceae bacterium]